MSNKVAQAAHPWVDSYNGMNGLWLANLNMPWAPVTQIIRGGTGNNCTWVGYYAGAGAVGDNNVGVGTLVSANVHASNTVVLGALSSAAGNSAVVIGPFVTRRRPLFSSCHTLSWSPMALSVISRTSLAASRWWRARRRRRGAAGCRTCCRSCRS